MGCRKAGGMAAALILPPTPEMLLPAGGTPENQLPREPRKRQQDEGNYRIPVAAVLPASADQNHRQIRDFPA
jgi:hypothetical protein